MAEHFSLAFSHTQSYTLGLSIRAAAAAAAQSGIVPESSAIVPPPSLLMKIDFQRPLLLLLLGDTRHCRTKEKEKEEEEVFHAVLGSFSLSFIFIFIFLSPFSFLHFLLTTTAHCPRLRQLGTISSK